MPSNTNGVDLKDVAIVSVQFLVQSQAVPPRILLRSKERAVANPTPQVQRGKSAGPTGIKIIDNVRDTMLQEDLGKVLEVEGLRLANVYSELRGEMCSVQFNFRRTDPKNPGFEEIRKEAEMFFNELSEKSTWTASIFKNPFFDAGVATEMSAIQIRCQNRQTNENVLLSSDTEIVVASGQLLVL